VRDGGAPDGRLDPVAACAVDIFRLGAAPDTTPEEALPWLRPGARAQMHTHP